MANITTITDYSNADISLVPGVPASKFDEFITKYEYEILTKLFGYPLYKKVMASPTTPIYADLINGKEYTSSYGVLTNWRGLKYVLVGMISFYYLRWVETQQSQQGMTQANFDSSKKVDDTSKMRLAWNTGVENALVCYDFMVMNQTLYPELWLDYDFFDYFDYIDDFE
jgi:hypothetical protein